MSAKLFSKDGSQSFDSLNRPFFQLHSALSSVTCEQDLPAVAPKSKQTDLLFDVSLLLGLAPVIYPQKYLTKVSKREHAVIQRTAELADAVIKNLKENENPKERDLNYPRMDELEAFAEMQHEMASWVQKAREISLRTTGNQTSSGKAGSQSRGQLHLQPTV